MSDDDEFLDDFMRRLDQQWQWHVDDEFDNLTSGVSTGATDQPCPMPLEWHPFYADKTWLVDWLNGTGQFAGLHIVQLPKMPPLRALLVTEDAPTTAAASDRITLTKQKCWGPAPYVGRPFAYVWPIATDDYGRGIAGEATLQYTMSEGEWFIYGGAE